MNIHDDIDIEELREEFRAPRRRSYDCCDGMCGAEDCSRCRGPLDATEGEE